MFTKQSRNTLLNILTYMLVLATGVESNACTKQPQPSRITSLDEFMSGQTYESAAMSCQIFHSSNTSACAATLYRASLLNRICDRIDNCDPDSGVISGVTRVNNDVDIETATGKIRITDAALFLFGDSNKKSSGATDSGAAQ